MTKSLFLATTAIALMFTAPVFGSEATGKVSEIIIKIETPDGPRWYTLGADLSKIDIRKGAVVTFDYADDTIEAIEVKKPDANNSKKDDN